MEKIYGRMRNLVLEILGKMTMTLCVTKRNNQIILFYLFEQSQLNTSSKKRGQDDNDKNDTVENKETKFLED